MKKAQICSLNNFCRKSKTKVETSRLRKIMARNNFTFMISISVLFVLFVLTVAHKPVTRLTDNSRNSMPYYSSNITQQIKILQVILPDSLFNDDRTWKP
jgi:hypothetical protein